MDKNYRVYLLVNTVNNRTYVGITNNYIRRIRQHNGELVGGARYTHNNKEDGEWKYYGYILDVDKRTSLSLEKRIKLRKSKGKTPLERRLKSIEYILNDYNTKFSTDYKFSIC